MRIEKIVCDKCGATVVEKHPDKIQVVKSYERVNAYSGKVMGRSYKTAETFHLCEKCRVEFYKFMNIAADTEGKAE